MIHIFPIEIQSIIFGYSSRNDYISFVRAYKSDIKLRLKGIHFDFDYMLSKFNSSYYYKVVLYYDGGSDEAPHTNIGIYHDISDAIYHLLNHFHDNLFHIFWDDSFSYFYDVLIMILDNHQIKYDYILNKYDIPSKLLKSDRFSYPMGNISHHDLDQVLPDLINLCQSVLKNDCLGLFQRLEKKAINFILDTPHDNHRSRFTFTENIPHGIFYSIKKCRINESFY